MRGSRLLVRADSFPPMLLFAILGEDYFCFPYAFSTPLPRCIGNEHTTDHGFEPSAFALA